MKEFWTRWYISLSTWFRDYVYIPLGGSKKGPIRSYINMWITFILSGMWHGASFNFILWGAIHAAYLHIERLIKLPEWLQKKIKFSKPLCILLVIFQVWIGWVFFRAETLSQALNILKIMFNFPGFFSGFSFNDANLYFILLIVLLREIFIDQKLFLFQYKINFLKKYQKEFQVIYLSILMALIVIFRGPGSDFIYFQF